MTNANALIDGELADPSITRSKMKSYQCQAQYCTAAANRSSSLFTLVRLHQETREAVEKANWNRDVRICVASHKISGKFAEPQHIATDCYEHQWDGSLSILHTLRL